MVSWKFLLLGERDYVQSTFHLLNNLVFLESNRCLHLICSPSLHLMVVILCNVLYFGCRPMGCIQFVRGWGLTEHTLIPLKGCFKDPHRRDQQCWMTPEGNHMHMIHIYWLGYIGFKLCIFFLFQDFNLVPPICWFMLIYVDLCPCKLVN